MKKLKILSVLLTTMLVCFILSACPSKKTNKDKEPDTLVTYTMSRSEELLGKVNKKIDESNDDYILKCGNTEIGTDIYYAFPNKQLIYFEKLTKENYDIKLSAHLAQGTLLKEDIDYLKENCEIKYSFRFMFFLGDYNTGEGASASYEIMIFENSDGAIAYSNWGRSTGVTGEGLINGNEIFYPDKNGSDYLGEITFEKLKEAFSEINALIDTY